MSKQKNIKLILGGTWHDFDSFSEAMKPLFESTGHTVTATYDLDSLTQLKLKHDGLVVLYTCLEEAQAGGSPFDTLSEAQVKALVKWVRGGGGLLAVHAATVAGQSSSALRALMGGAFESHPPQFSFTVYPTYRAHPITDGVHAFTVFDEFYVQSYDDTVEIHMVALDRGVAHPMVWSKSEGLGRVAYVAMGHDAGVWEQHPYQQLMIQASQWLMA